MASLLFVMFFLLWGGLSLINIAQDARDRVDAQNGADAVNLAVAEMAARDLNVMTMNHVASSQSYTIAVSSMAVALTKGATIARSTAAAVEASALCISTYFTHVLACAAAISYGLFTTQRIMSYFALSPHRGVTVGNRVTSALDAMNAHLVETYPQRASLLTRELSDANGIEAVFAFPVCEGARCADNGDFRSHALPVEKANLLASRSEMCAGIYRGSETPTRGDYAKHGFAVGKGPLTEGGSASNPKLRDFINKQENFNFILPLLDVSILFTSTFVSHSSFTTFNSRQRSNDNQFLDIFDNQWTIACLGTGDPASVSKLFSGGVGGIGQTLISAVAQLGITKPTNYWPKGRSQSLGLLTNVVSSFAGSFGGYISAGAAGMQADMTDFQFLHVVAKTKRDRLKPLDFEFDEKPLFAYSQALVFNEASHDLYTGRWNADLAPALHMDEPNKVLQAMRSKAAPKSFEKLQRILSAGGSPSDWAIANAH